MSSGSASYRPEVDGLRAVAVLAVLAFHLNSKWLPGGFVGVDVFFVISGFLISRIILEELAESNRFQFGRFYARRVRRLFPALFVTLILSTFVAVKVLSPPQLERFAGSLCHSLASLSNFFFWGESGYFDLASDSKPLLHTWSLSVEEQFYLFWPISLVLAHRVHKKRGPLAWILLTIFGSFLLNLGVLRGSFSHFSLLGNDSTQVQSAVFFLTPFRMFELALGGLGHFLVDRLPRRHIVTLGLSVAGLALIAAAYVLFDSRMDFPSAPALIPCLGTLLVVSARPQGRATWLLGSRPLVAIGKASYSIYLLHWPMLVLYKQWVYRPLATSDLLGVLAASAAGGAIMYRFVEQPFRRPTQVLSQEGAGFALGATGLSLLLCVLGANILSREGWPGRLALPPNVKTNLGGSTWDRLKALGAPIGPTKKGKRVLLLGDSQMADFINIAESEMRSRGAVLRSFTIRAECLKYLAEGQPVRSEVQPLVPWDGGWNPATIKRHCPASLRHVRRLLTDESFDQVIVALLWQADHRPYVGGFLGNLEKWGHAPVALVGNKELRGSTLALDSLLIATHCVGRRVNCSSIEDINEFGVSYLGSRDALVTDFLSILSSAQKIPFFDLAGAVCSVQKCLIYLESGTPVYKDKSHFNASAYKGVAHHVEKPLNRFLDQALGKP